MRFLCQRRLRAAILVVMTIFASVLLAVRAGYLAPPTRLVFTTAILTLVCPTLLWWAWLDEHLSNRTHACGKALKWRGLLRGGLAACTCLVMMPAVLFLAAPHYYDSLPVMVLTWLMSWHLSVASAGVIAVVAWIVSSVARRFRCLRIQPALRGTASPSADPVQVETALSRRALLTGTLAAAPFVLSGTGVAIGIRQQGRFITRRVTIQVPRLPDRLRGLTITQVSDFHVGRFFRPEHLPRVIDAVNRLDSDLIAITGDTVDHVADFFAPACNAFQQMGSRYGCYLVLGNHDLIDASLDVGRYLRQQFGPEFLANERQVLDIGGEHVQLVGLDWSGPRCGGRGENNVDEGDVSRSMSGIDQSMFTLALAHHPHAFDALADAGVDLTLAGHTHGGQVMLTPPGLPARLGGGNLLFRYVWGEYRRGRSAMYVTSGVGNWFPVRINAPAEIVQIRVI